MGAWRGFTDDSMISRDSHLLCRQTQHWEMQRALSAGRVGEPTGWGSGAGGQRLPRAGKLEARQAEAARPRASLLMRLRPDPVPVCSRRLVREVPAAPRMPRF